VVAAYQPPGPEDVRAWAEFRAALRELGRLDPERARIYLGEAAAGLKVWVRALQTRRPGPSRPAPPRPDSRGTPDPAPDPITAPGATQRVNPRRNPS
jgi:hypothetical protein